MSKKETLGLIFAYAFILTAAVYMLLPILRVVEMSFQPAEAFFSAKRTLIPETVTLVNYTRLFFETWYTRWLSNSIIIAILQTVLTVTVCAFAAYGYTIYNFWGKESSFILILSTMMIPTAVGAPALFIMFGVLNLLNTYFAVVIPGIASVFGLFFMRSYMETAVVGEVVDAGRIDGASELQIFFRIVLPTLTPGLAALSILVFTGSFNEYFWPLLALRTEDMYTIQLGLPTWLVTLGTMKVRLDVLSAGVVVSTIPTLLIFIFLQKYLISGIALGAVKR